MIITSNIQHYTLKFKERRSTKSDGYINRIRLTFFFFFIIAPTGIIMTFVTTICIYVHIYIMII